MALYIGIFDARKAIRHVPVEIDLAAIANSVSGLSETLGDSKEMIYHNESHHALVIVNTAKATKILSKHILNTLNPVNISMNGCIQHLKANYCCKNGTTHQFIKGECVLWDYREKTWEILLYQFMERKRQKVCQIIAVNLEMLDFIKLHPFLPQASSSFLLHRLTHKEKQHNFPVVARVPFL